MPAIIIHRVVNHANNNMRMARRKFVISLGYCCALASLCVSLWFSLFYGPQILQDKEDGGLPSDVLALRRFPNCGVHHFSSLPLKTQKERNAWSANVAGSVPPYVGRFSLVLSIYKRPLDWLPEYLGEHASAVKDITIISKYHGHTPDEQAALSANLTKALWRQHNYTSEQEAPPPITIQWITLPNVGRCDHSYAYWMSNHIVVQQGSAANTSVGRDDIVVFIKDNVIVHQEASIQHDIGEMLRIASSTGFGCSQVRSQFDSSYHVTSILSTFNSTFYVNPLDQNGYANNTFFKSKFRNFGKWLDTMGIQLPKPLTLVCYGGIFAVRGDRLWDPPGKTNADASAHDLYDRLVHSLDRADSIEEGHFAERAWAGLFATPLPAHTAKALMLHATNMFCQQVGILGALQVKRRPNIIKKRHVVLGILVCLLLLGAKKLQWPSISSKADSKLSHNE